MRAEETVHDLVLGEGSCARQALGYTVLNRHVVMVEGADHSIEERFDEGASRASLYQVAGDGDAKDGEVCRCNWEHRAWERRSSGRPTREQ